MLDTLSPRALNSGISAAISVVLPEPDQPEMVRTAKRIQTAGGGALTWRNPAVR